MLQVIPLEAAELAHQMVHKEKALAPAGKYAPKYFTPKQYEMILSLCDTIIPKDEKSGGAIEAGAPEFIDLLTSENENYQLALGGGLMWLDTHCIDQYGKTYMEVPLEQRKEDHRSHRLPPKRQKGTGAQPGSGVLCVSAQDDLRRFLHQQNWYRRLAVYRQRDAERMAGLSAAAGIDPG